MPYIEVKMEQTDEVTAASIKRIRVRGLEFITPEKIPSSPEVSSLKGLKLPQSEDLGHVLVAERLIYPDTLKRLTSEENFFKGFIRRIAGEVSKDEDILLIYLCFKGDAKVEEPSQLRTLFDLQFLAGADIITVQQPYGSSWKEFRSSLSYAEDWREERGVEAALMPVLDTHMEGEEFMEGIRELRDRGYSTLGLDLRGSFPYMALRALESSSDKLNGVWVHAFQTPPKVRLGRGFHACAEGMILPSFGVDSFSRWIVPPPPEPLTKDKINVFDRLGWGFMKRGEWVKHRGSSLGCDCTICRDRDLTSFFEGTVMTALRRGKVHDHLAQSSELRSVRGSVKEYGFHKLLREKEFPKRLLSYLEKLRG